MRTSLTFILVLLTLAMIAACARDAVPTPTTSPPLAPPLTPTPAPTATPDLSGFTSYEDQELGVWLLHPEGWEAAVADNPDQRLTLSGDDGVSRLTLMTLFDAVDTPLSERLDSVIEMLTPEDAPVGVERYGPVTLTYGSLAERADITYEEDGAAAVRRVQVANRGGFTFVLALSTLASELERQGEMFETMLSSFTSFPPAPYGIARNRAFTMPVGQPSSLDPAVVRETTSHLFVSALFSGLVRFGPDLSIEPDLAERWDVDAAGVAYTFTLRDGITFHDGRPITAADFKYSIERAGEPELHSDTAPLYLGDIVGMEEKLSGDAAEISGLEAVDESTVRITIDSPKDYFLAKLTYPSSAVVDRRDIEGQGEDWWQSADVNGSGPYKLMRWDPEEVIILQRFNGHHTPSDLEYFISPLVGLPGASTLDMYFTDAWDGLFVGPGSLGIVRDDPDLSQQLREYDQLTTFFVVLDGTRPPFDDPEVRRAFAMALDREKFAEEIYNGNVTVANGLLPPGIPGYSESLQGIPFDPEGARQLLSKSQYGDGLPEIIFTTVDVDGQPPGSVQFLLDEWNAELGVDIKVDLLEPEVYYYELESVAEHLLVYGWVADYPDPENFLDLLLHSESHDSRYANPQFDDLVEGARVERDRETRLGLYQEAEQLLMDDTGIIPLFHFRDYVILRPHVRDFRLNILGQPDLSGISLGSIRP